MPGRPRPQGSPATWVLHALRVCGSVAHQSSAAWFPHGFARLASARIVSSRAIPPGSPAWRFPATNHRLQPPHRKFACRAAPRAGKVSSRPVSQASPALGTSKRCGSGNTPGDAIGAPPSIVITIRPQAWLRGASVPYHSVSCATGWTSRPPVCCALPVSTTRNAF